MKRIKKIMLICICLIIVLFIIRLYIDHRLIKITSYDVYSNKLPDAFNGFKIVQISDLHNENLNNQILDKVNKENPDIVVLTGDMVSANQTNYSNFLSLAKNLSMKYPVYYIKGNHEGELSGSNYKVIKDALNAYGIKILDNEKVKIEKENNYINLYGMWVNQRYYSRANIDKDYKVTKDTLIKLLGNVNEAEYNILLMHTPSYFDAYVEWKADLVISGHTHGGLIRIPFLGGVFSPDRKLFQKYCYGKYENGGTTMIISSGLSKGETGFRLFNRPEIVTINLLKGN